jgi:hypothetical protein
MSEPTVMTQLGTARRSLASSGVSAPARAPAESTTSTI